MEHLTEWERGGECGDGHGGPFDHDYTEHLREIRRNEDGTFYLCRSSGCERRVFIGAWDAESDHCVFHREDGWTVHMYLGHKISRTEDGRWMTDLPPGEVFDTPEAAMAAVHEYKNGETQ